ncbi:MAG: FitA-like ribbon-helix-helix domain-containing protein [Burkholderiales bacterium]
MKDVATLTIRNVPMRIVHGLKSLAKRRGQSMEQEVRDLLEAHVAERTSVLRQIETSWNRQSRKPSAAEIDSWIAAGRE